MKVRPMHRLLRHHDRMQITRVLHHPAPLLRPKGRIQIANNPIRRLRRHQLFSHLAHRKAPARLQMLNEVQLPPQKVRIVGVHVGRRLDHVRRQADVQLQRAELLIDIGGDIGVDGHIVVDGALHLVAQVGEQQPDQLAIVVGAIADERLAVQVLVAAGAVVTVVEQAGRALLGLAEGRRRNSGGCF